MVVVEVSQVLFFYRDVGVGGHDMTLPHFQWEDKQQEAMFHFQDFPHRLNTVGKLVLLYGLKTPSFSDCRLSAPSAHVLLCVNWKIGNVHRSAAGARRFVSRWLLRYRRQDFLWPAGILSPSWKCCGVRSTCVVSSGCEIICERVCV